MSEKTHKTVSLPPPSAPSNGPLTPIDDLVDDEEQWAKEELKRIMPSKDRLRKIAAKCGPLPKWLDEDEPCPF